MDSNRLDELKRETDALHNQVCVWGGWGDWGRSGGWLGRGGGGLGQEWWVGWGGGGDWGRSGVQTDAHCIVRCVCW